MGALREEQQSMGGKNPYIEETKFAPATKKYKVTFVREGKTVEIDPAASWIFRRAITWAWTTPAVACARVPHAT
jgi:hypothetical protein